MKEQIHLNKIRTDGGTQPRAELKDDVIEEYADCLEREDQFPEILVFYDGKDYWLTDGFHRYHAYKELEIKKIPCQVEQGTRRDAVLRSAGVNAKHGLRRTNADKHRAVTKLLEDEEWSKWSDHEIAKRCQVGHVLVNRMRKESSLFLKNGDNQERTYIDKYGNETTMDISKMGGDKKKKETNPEIKSKIKEVNAAIESGEVNFKDLQDTRKAISKSDTDEEQQKEFRSNFKQKSRIERLHDRLGTIIDELTYFADGVIEIEEGDGPWITGIKAKGPDFITQFYKMGVDPIRVWNLINPNKEISHESKSKEREERHSSKGAIDITPKQNS